MNMTATAPHKSLPVLLNPENAYNAFFSVAAGGKAERRFHLKRNLLDYMVEDIKKAKKQLGPVGGVEIEAYLSAFDELARRQDSLLRNRKVLARSIKPMDNRFTSEVATERTSFCSGRPPLSFFFSPVGPNTGMMQDYELRPKLVG